jgi:hypothetical protein
MDKNLLDAATSNFSLPHDVVQLPTKGLFYKSKKKTIKVGYLTASDENLLVNSRNSNQNIILNLLRNKIYEHDIRPEELMESDVEAILIFLRNTAFGPEYTLSVTDPKTDKTFETTISLDELDIIKNEYNPDEDGTFTIKLPRSGDLVKVRPLSIGETNELETMAQSYPQGRVAPVVTWRLVKMIDSINGNEDKGTIATYVEQMPIMDSKYIRNFVKDNVPSLDLKRTVRTPSGELVTISVAFGVDFFRPFF